jgi:hypothetical protein
MLTKIELTRPANPLKSNDTYINLARMDKHILIRVRVPCISKLKERGIEFVDNPARVKTYPTIEVCHVPDAASIHFWDQVQVDESHVLFRNWRVKDDEETFGRMQHYANLIHAEIDFNAIKSAVMELFVEFC